MQIFFLEARVPLTKKFTASSKSPYPNAFEFKSHSAVAKSLEHFAELLKHHAAKGHCLLKGELDRPLEWESRAGHTNPNQPTRSICFDLDGLRSVNNVEDFMARIGLPSLSYVVQWSASYGINGDFTLRTHVLVFTADSVAPMALKQYLKQLNLTLFQSDLKLTKTNTSLSWGVDITTCQNDKLIYIAPPECDPPTINHFKGERISYVSKQDHFLDFNKVTLLSTEQLKKLEETEINRLRAANNLPERKATQFKLKELKGEHYLPNPDQATVTSIKEERGFVYLNLNGGDSWGYYHPADNPTFIYNFKGEPTYKTSELVPDYWASLQQSKQQAVRAASAGKIFLQFRDMKTAEYYNGWYEPTPDEVTLHGAKNEKQLADFLINHGQPVPEAVPIWNYIYDPNAPTIDFATQTVNRFRPSKYMKHARQVAKTAPAATKDQFPTICKVISHVFGAAMLDHYLNHEAFCFQYRTAPGTAWVAHGTQGTGKGILTHKILSPLYGSSNVSVRRMEELEDRYNGYLEESLKTIIDEAQISESGRNKVIMANLKNYITEPTITVRRMRQASYEVPNRAGWIFCSNMPDPVSISSADRRFNVGEYQETPLVITDAEIAHIEQELTSFALYLQQLQVDLAAVRTPINNEAKQQMVMVSNSSADAVADALRSGKLGFFWECLPTVAESLLDPATQVRLAPYKQVVYDLVTTRRNKLTREEIFVLFNYNVGNVPSSPHKLTTYLKHHGLQIRDVWHNGKTTRGVATEWVDSEDWFVARAAEIAVERQPRLATVSTLKSVAHNDTALKTV